MILSAATHPDDPAAMLTAAEAIEVELSKKSIPGASALAVEEEPKEQQQHCPSEESEPTIMSRIDELVAAVNQFCLRGGPRRRANTRGGSCVNVHQITCFDCKRKGLPERLTRAISTLAGEGARRSIPQRAVHIQERSDEGAFWKRQSDFPHRRRR